MKPKLKVSALCFALLLASGRQPAECAEPEVMKRSNADHGAVSQRPSVAQEVCAVAMSRPSVATRTERVVPPARFMYGDPDVQETFESETVGEMPSNWKLVTSVGGGNYDALWRVTDYGGPYGKVVSATAVYDTGPGTFVSHLAYQGTSGPIVEGAIPRDAHYYVETLIHMKEDVANWANEHTLQGIVQDDYNLEVLIWSATHGQQWGLRLYSNGGEETIADWGSPGRGITESTGQTGWNWWARVGLDIDLRTTEVGVYYAGQLVIGPVMVESIASKALASGKDILIDLRTTNNLLDGDDVRIYLVSTTAVERDSWPRIKGTFR